MYVYNSKISKYCLYYIPYGKIDKSIIALKN